MLWVTRLLDQSTDHQGIIECRHAIQAEKNKMTPSIPEHLLLTLDGMLTNRYKNMNAK